jgi:16S rRNA processing protein RimM
LTLVSAGRVGRAHGLDGSFYVEGAEHPLPTETAVTVGGEERRVLTRAGTDRRPLVRLSGIERREEAAAVKGEPLLVEARLEQEEWLAAALVGREVVGLGRVSRVLEGLSCDVLELEDGSLVPFVSDAIRSVGEVIEVDAEFLGL